MASIRSPSPTGDAASTSGSPALSPRSKLQKELAALDESSDEETTGPIDTKALFKKLDEAKLQNAEKPVQPATSTDAVEQEKDDDDEEDEDEEEEDDEVIRPRGRIAARMLAGTTKKAASPSKSPSKTTQSRESTSRPPSDQEDADEEDDDEVSTLPRRRRVARPQRSQSPEDASNAKRPVSPGLFVSPSPSPQKKNNNATAAGSDTEDELPADLTKSSRFQALVARKRQERLQKEAEEQKKRDERAKRMAEQMPAGVEDTEEDDVSDITDDEGGQKLTQSSSARRPARKASKKAIEEMNRETQRMARSMQLAHEAKTKKKITKNSLFERFNFRPAGAEEPAPATNLPPSSSRPTTPISGAQTDAEAGEAATPPSSPPSAVKRVMGASGPLTTSTEGAVADAHTDKDVQLPSLDEVASETKTLDKGKSVATAADLKPSPKKKTAAPKRQFRVKFPQAPVEVNKVAIDSDSEPELQILNPKQSKIDAIFARMPAKKAQGSRSLHDLHQLAQIHSSPPPNARRGKPVKVGMNAVEMQAQLYERARAQAKLERERRLDALKAKGIVVQTEEEREREREQVEDIVARARQEAEEIMDREREDAKQARKERRENGEGDDAVGWDDSDDDSFEGSDLGEPVEEGEIEFSGSEDEENEENEETEKAGNPLFDEDAAEDEDGESEPEDAVTPKAKGTRKQVSDDEDGDISPSQPRARRARKSVRVLSDDEEEEEKQMEAKTPKPKTRTFDSPLGHHSSSPKIPTSVLRSATKTFIPGLPVPLAGPAGLGLTQIFAGTMDDSQASQAGQLGNSSPEFLPSTANFPDSQFSLTAEVQAPTLNEDELVFDSQSETQKRETQGVQLHFSQSQTHGFDSLLQMDSTQMSDLQPTQDNGFAEASPLKSRFIEVPGGTVDTVVLNGTPVKPRQAAVEQMESPLVIRKKGKLRRRGDAAAPEDASVPATEASGSPLVNMELPVTVPEAAAQDEEAASAFKLMAKAARRKQRLQAKFDAKKSKARDMVEEQADESEDEYAGLGGADGEDESDEEAEQELRKQMIDDAEGNDINEHKLAALFNERERKEEAAQVDKLFHDITTGMLRKRRRHGGGDNGAFDLSDSDDGGEARKRMKRRQFQKMQKALFADERIGKIAENPRNAAFLKSIEDRGSDDELDFDPNAVDEQDEEDSQNNSQGQREEAQEERIPDSQPATSEDNQAQNQNLGRKRNRLEPDHTARLPPALRKARDANTTRVPTSITDVKRSLSSLLDDDHAIIPATDPLESEGSDDEAAADESNSSNKENGRSSRTVVVDRISLKRSGSSGLSTSRQAFAAPSNSGGSGVFKVPALLRKATTNNSLISQSSNLSNTGTTTAGGVGSSKIGGGVGGAGAEDGKLKKNAGKRSGINFFARENERREKVRESEMRREKKKWKGVGDRSKAVSGLFGSGSFE